MFKWSVIKAKNMSRHKFLPTLNKNETARTEGLSCEHYLGLVTSHKQVLDNIQHEDFHIEINRATGGKTTEKQDHYIMKRMELEWF